MPSNYEKYLAARGADSTVTSSGEFVNLHRNVSNLSETLDTVEKRTATIVYKLFGPYPSKEIDDCVEPSAVGMVDMLKVSINDCQTLANRLIMLTNKLESLVGE